jgi:hypothetical protein
VPATSYYRHPEWRYTLMGTLKQPLRGGSLYEQMRGELLTSATAKESCSIFRGCASALGRTSTLEKVGHGSANHTWAYMRKPSCSFRDRRTPM